MLCEETVAFGLSSLSFSYGPLWSCAVIHWSEWRLFPPPANQFFPSLILVNGTFVPPCLLSNCRVQNLAHTHVY